MYLICLKLVLVVCFDFSENTSETVLRMRTVFVPQEKGDVLYLYFAPDTLAPLRFQTAVCTIEHVYVDNRNVPISTQLEVVFGGSQRHARCSLVLP